MLSALLNKTFPSLSITTHCQFSLDLSELAYKCLYKFVLSRLGVNIILNIANIITFTVFFIFAKKDIAINEQ